MLEKNMQKKPKILLFDIETMANLAWVWGKYEQNVIEYDKEWYILCFAYKWLDEKKTHAVGLTDFKNYKKNREDDKAIVQALWDLFDEADVIIAHNGDAFDIKMVNARFLYHGFPPPSPFKSLDTKKIMKTVARANSNKLDDLGNYFGLGRKIDTGGFELWLGCRNNDASAWKKMLAYNKQDVILLEKVYLKLRPWIKNHPNMNVYFENRIGCPNCGKTHMTKSKRRPTKMGLKQQYQCQDCGAYATDSKTLRITELSN